MKRTGFFATKSEQHNRVTFAGLVEAFLLLCLAAVIAVVTLSGQYTLFTTPRAFVYLIIASVLLVVLAFCAACGWFAVSSRDSWRILISVALPALLIIIPLQSSQSLSSSGFDRYAGGRAIAIRYNSRLSGLNEKSREIKVKNDDFGLWYDEIDHNLSKYEGYTITITGFVSRDATLGANQFRISRQLMSCCILDMSPFGLVAEYSSSKNLAEHKWVQLRARIERGNVGVHGYQRAGVVLRVMSLRTAQAPTGYFYRP
ncbi:TIGR03943 family protein [Bifidobacteriaceae bacterium NR002]|nr:TIGR03943 family protein [Bifidobacteriaceae bacterium NR002]MDZ7549044.1 TIGR03943 family protein [Bifidobacteriaceae bacterium NR047]